MEDARARECRTREAESLEQAKQTNHEDLKHLHETIAQQWHRLAEVIETGRASTQPPIATAPDVPVPELTADATSDTPTALPIERLEGADNGVAQVSSGAEEIERRDQVCENDHGGREDSLDAEDSETLDQRIVGSAHSGAQTNAGAQATASLDNRISDIDTAHVSLDLESSGDQITRADHSDAEVRPGLAGVESLNDQISETDHSTVQVRAGSGRIDSPDDQIVETDRCVAGVDRDTGSLENPDEPILQTMHGAGEVSSGTERFESAGDQTSRTDQVTAQVNPGVGDFESLDDQSSENDRGPSTGSAQTPFEWFLSSWFRGGGR